MVIGILITLSINNWNDNCKVQQRETQILKELKSDMLRTKNDIEEAVNSHKEVLGLGQYLLDAIHLKVPYSDSIYGALSRASNEFKIVPKTSSFENLKTIGLNTISNDSLRIAITNLFQLRFARLKNDMRPEGETQFSIEGMLFPFQNKYFDIDFLKPYKRARKYSDTLNLYRLKIRDYENFLNDTELYKMLQLTMYIRSNMVEDEMDVVEEIDSVVVSIDEKLKER